MGNNVVNHRHGQINKTNMSLQINAHIKTQETKGITKNWREKERERGKVSSEDPQESIPEFVQLSIFINGLGKGINNKKTIQNSQFCADFKDSQKELTMLNDRMIRLQLNFNTNEYKLMHLGEKNITTHTKL